MNPAIIALIPTVLSGFSSLLQALTADGVAAPTGSIATIVTALEQIVPAAIQEGQDILPLVQSFIAEVMTNAAVTADQIAVLTAQSAQIDAAFEAAAKADGV
jgi:hypothetical protein